jgi:hypothetical protein
MRRPCGMRAATLARARLSGRIAALDQRRVVGRRRSPGLAVRLGDLVTGKGAHARADDRPACAMSRHAAQHPAADSPDNRAGGRGPAA